MHPRKQRVDINIVNDAALLLSTVHIIVVARCVEDVCELTRSGSLGPKSATHSLHLAERDIASVSID